MNKLPHITSANINKLVRSGSILLSENSTADILRNIYQEPSEIECKKDNAC